MLINEKVEVDQSIRKLLLKPEFVMPLTFHFRLVSNATVGSELEALFYPSERPANFSILEFHRKFQVKMMLLFNEYLYVLDDRKGIRYKIRFMGTSSLRDLNISVEAERDSAMKRLPISEDHLLQHVVSSLRRISN